jgi:hypothetical protein
MLTADFFDILLQDKRVTQDEWAALKGQTPFGQIPVLEVGGHHVAQSGAIGECAIISVQAADAAAALSAEHYAKSTMPLAGLIA